MDHMLGRRVQLAAPGSLIELFDLDLSTIDPTAGVLHFYPDSDESRAFGEVLWRGNSYAPQPIKIEGIETAAQGSLPRPKITISNILGTVTALIREYGRVSGAVLTRWQTFDRYLDNGNAPNPDGHFPIDVFVLDRVVEYNRIQVQIECRSFLDFEQKQLPGRLIFQSACSHSYRLWDATLGEFDYTKATCPYAGDLMYNELGQEVYVGASDSCGRKLSDCRLRFPGQALPTRAFVGAGRY